METRRLPQPWHLNAGQTHRYIEEDKPNVSGQPHSIGTGTDSFATHSKDFFSNRKYINDQVPQRAASMKHTIPSVGQRVDGSHLLQSPCCVVRSATTLFSTVVDRVHSWLHFHWGSFRYSLSPFVLLHISQTRPNESNETPCQLPGFEGYRSSAPQIIHELYHNMHPIYIYICVLKVNSLIRSCGNAHS